MTKLFCVVVREGAVFPVDIDLSETVSDLKKKIKMKMPNLVRIDAPFLRFYLAKERDKWPDSRDEAIKALTAESAPDRIKHLMQKDLLLDATSSLNDVECFGNNFERADDDVHVLVDYPDAGQVLKYVYYKHIGWIP